MRCGGAITASSFLVVQRAVEDAWASGVRVTKRLATANVTATRVTTVPIARQDVTSLCDSIEAMEVGHLKTLQHYH
jgi:hypothetical protein